MCSNAEKTGVYNIIEGVQRRGGSFPKTAVMKRCVLLNSAVALKVRAGENWVPVHRKAGLFISV